MMAFDDFASLVKNRRSIRYFSKKSSVERGVIEKILKLAHESPSVENIQPWRFYVIEDEKMKEKIMQHSCYGNFIVGAGVLIVVTCDRSAKSHQTTAPIWNPKELEYSCSNAMLSMMLGATALGLGSCWVSLHHGPVHDVLHLKDHETVIGGVMIGMMKEDDQQPSIGHDRQDVQNVITYLN